MIKCMVFLCSEMHFETSTGQRPTNIKINILNTKAHSDRNKIRIY